MMHVVQYRSYRQLTPEQRMQGVETAQALQKAFANVKGTRSCKLTIGQGTFAYFGDIENFAVVDKVLADPTVQATLGKLMLEFGFQLASSEYFYDLEQVLPIVKK